LAIGSAIAIYFIIWWIVLFAILPFGVRSQVEEGHVVPGSEPGAPAQARLLRVALWTTVAATIVFAGLLGLLNQDYLTLDSFWFMPGGRVEP
jgi:predicted secreted protein